MNLLGWALLACGAPDAPDSPVADCAPYAADPSAHGFCLTRAASARPATPEIAALSADTLCGPAGPTEADCRLAWVQARLPELPLDALLDACGAAPDCALAALDGRPLPLLEQLPLCRERAGPYALDCARHALNRWVAASSADPADLASLATPWPEEIGKYMAAAVVCRERGACAGAPEVASACEAAVAEVRADPGICARLDRAP